MEFWETLENRHSVREFDSEPVSHELIDRVLHAASLAPSIVNRQPWRFHVATGESRLRIGGIVSQTTVHLKEYIDVMGPDRYEAAVAWYSELGGAPVVIGVSRPVTKSEFELNNALLSIGAAIENLLLAVTAEGAAACNITFSWWVRGELEEVFEVGEDRSIIAIIALGHPTKTPAAAPPKNPDVADWLG